MKKLPFISLILLVTSAFAEQPMETDRPDFTEGAQTVASEKTQLEFGYTYTKAGAGFEEHMAPELLVRLGAGDETEIRLFWGGYTKNDDIEGVSDASIGFKQRFREQDNFIPAVSMIGELGLPVGSSEVSSDEVETVAKFIWTYDFGLAGNINFATPVGEEGRYLEVSTSVAASASISSDVGMYGEYFGLFPAEDVVETTEHYLNGGFTWAITPDLQLDARAGFGLNDAAADFFTGTGLSLRF